jgi:D-psicose/D-tagatose/L-ribulose 3-epimerase
MENGMTAFRPRLALCNEVVREMAWAEQCAFAAKLGYDGLEVAPFTLADGPDELTDAQICEFRRIADDNGIAITGLHWLLVAPEGLSITSPDPTVMTHTRDFIVRLVDLCAALGGRVLVHGSPNQRQSGGDHAGAMQRAASAFAIAGETAARAGVIYCIEPLGRRETDVINTFDEAAAIVRQIGNPALRTMVDTSAAAQSEQEDVPALITRALSTALVAHIQFNDLNRKGPGQGEQRFLPILHALKDGGYTGDIAIEPFIYEPDGPGCAARAIGYVRGLMEALI